MVLSSVSLGLKYNLLNNNNNNNNNNIKIIMKDKLLSSCNIWSSKRNIGNN